MHICDQVYEALDADSWNVTVGQPVSEYWKRTENYAEAGSLSSGTRVVRLRIDASGRWLERVDGWGKVEKDVDLRDYPNDPTAAIRAALA